MLVTPGLINAGNAALLQDAYIYSHLKIRVHYILFVLVK